MGTKISGYEHGTQAPCCPTVLMTMMADGEISVLQAVGVVTGDAVMTQSTRGL